MLPAQIGSQQFFSLLSYEVLQFGFQSVTNDLFLKDSVSEKQGYSSASHLKI